MYGFLFFLTLILFAICLGVGLLRARTADIIAKESEMIDNALSGYRRPALVPPSSRGVSTRRLARATLATGVALVAAAVPTVVVGEGPADLLSPSVAVVLASVCGGMFVSARQGRWLLVALPLFAAGIDVTVSALTPVPHATVLLVVGFVGLLGVLVSTYRGGDHAASAWTKVR